MYSSKLYYKRLCMGLLIYLLPFTINASLPTQRQQYDNIYTLDDHEESLGALPLQDVNDYPDFVEQTYPIDDNYGATQKG